MKITKDIIIQAREASLVSYLQSIGHTFQTEGKRKRCKELKNLVITEENSFYWNGHETFGNSIDFLVNHLDMDFLDAVEKLTNINLKYEKSHIVLPTKDNSRDSSYIITGENINRAYAYLSTHRKIATDIITNLVDKGYLSMIAGERYPYPPMGFKIEDENLQPLGYELQGTMDKVRFKGFTADVRNTSFGFNIKIGNPLKAFYFESAIDLISFYQLWKFNTIKIDLKDSLLVSMGGLKVSTLTNTLRAFNISSDPYIAVDSDDAGYNFKASLKSQQIAFKDYPVPSHKDWNEYLKSIY